MSVPSFRSHRQCFVVMVAGEPAGVFTDGFAAEAYAEATSGSVTTTPFVRKGMLPSPKILRQVLRYEPDTGKLFWRPRPRNMFESDFAFKGWHRKCVDKEAMTTFDNYGYLRGKVLGRGLQAHRVALAITHGVWPGECVDHINGDRRDNRLVNLRVATFSDNSRNSRLSKTNKSGRVGVHWSPSKRRWRAVICRTDLGRFITFEEACAAREKAEREQGYHPNHGRAA